MRRGELGGEHHVAVRVDGADLPEAARLDGEAVGQLAAALVERQQADAVAVRGADEASVRAEAQLFDVAPADVGLLDVVGEAEGAAGGDQRASGCSLLELIDAGPLRETGRRKETELEAVSVTRCDLKLLRDSGLWSTFRLDCMKTTFLYGCLCLEVFEHLVVECTRPLWFRGKALEIG